MGGNIWPPTLSSSPEENKFNINHQFTDISHTLSPLTAFCYEIGMYIFIYFTLSLFELKRYLSQPH